MLGKLELPMADQTLPTWAPPRRARRPKVIPLIFSDIQSSTRQVLLAIHQDLAETVRFHPYRGRSIPLPNSTRAEPQDLGESPPSPLTPSPEDKDKDENEVADHNHTHPATLPGPSTIMYTSAPPGFTLTHSGWNKTLIQSLRVSFYCVFTCYSI